MKILRIFVLFLIFFDNMNIVAEEDSIFISFSNCEENRLQLRLSGTMHGERVDYTGQCIVLSSDVNIDSAIKYVIQESEYWGFYLEKDSARAFVWKIDNYYYLPFSVDSLFKAFGLDFNLWKDIIYQELKNRPPAWGDSLKTSLRGKAVWARFAKKYGYFWRGRNLKAIIQEVNFEKCEWCPTSEDGFNAWDIELILLKDTNDVDTFSYYSIYSSSKFKEKFENDFTKLSPSKRMEIWTKKYGKKQAEAIMNREVVLGMTKEAVRESWGEPKDINRTVGSWGVHEQWVYDDAFLYFENGIFTSFQD